MPGTHTSAGIEKRLGDAALRLLERTSWSELTLAAVARASRLSLAAVFPVAASKAALARVILRGIAEETALRHHADRASQSPRERTFDAAMTWFDVQQSHKRGLGGFYRGLRSDPLTLLSVRSEIVACAQRILALAEADIGAMEPARAAIVSGILVRATLAWLDDDKEMSRTMAQLDRDLRGGERFLWPGSSGKGRKPGRRSSPTR